MRGGLPGLVAAVLVASVVSAGPASAESGHAAKTVGDAPAAIDITGISADNGPRRVRVELEVPGLGHSGTFTFSYDSARYDGMAVEVRERRGQVRTKVFHCGEDSCARVRCRGVHVRWDVAGHRLKASVPQSCYPLRVPDAWNFNGHSDLGRDYDSEFTRLRLRRG